MHTRFGQRLAVVDEHVAGLHNIVHALQTCSHSALGTKHVWLQRLLLQQSSYAINAAVYLVQSL